MTESGNSENHNATLVNPRVLGVVDCEVHPTVPGGLEAIFPYVTHGMRKRLEPMRRPDPFQMTPGRARHVMGDAVLRPDAVPPSGGAPGSDPHFMATDHFDANNVAAAVLLPIQPARTDSWTDADAAAAVCTAYNNLIADQWLSADPRFRMALVVSPHDAERAASEIRRFGPTKNVVGVYLPLLNILLGNRQFHPIYDAAQELDLPIIVHPTGSQGDFISTPHYAAGAPGTFAERHALLSEIAISNLTELIFEGAFETFPRLKVMFAEFGWTWVPPLMWQMNAAWKSARPMHPWMRKPPSEYVAQHVRFTSSPALEIPNDRYLNSTLDMLLDSTILLFSSNYPRRDSDRPTGVFNNVAPEVANRIFRDNAIQFFGDRLGLTPAVA